MKKPNKIYRQKLDVKQENIVKLQALQHPDDIDCPIKLLLECLNENESLKQAALLKKISVAINKAVTRDDDRPFKTCLEVLALMFVVADNKNPARRTVASLFDNLPGQLHNDALQCLSLTVLGRLEEKVNQIAVTGCGLRPTIDMVSSLMENFKLVLRCLSIYLKHLVQNTRTVTNPVDQTVTMNDCLASTKAIIAVLQKSCRHTTEELPQETSPDMLLHASWMNQLKAVATELVTILNSDFLPDCQTASGMALCLIICLTSHQDALSQVILETIFPHCLVAPQTVKQHWILTMMAQGNWLQAPSSFAHLCLCHGVLTMVPLKDLIRPLDCSELLQDKSSSDSSNPPTLLFNIIFQDVCLLCERLKEPFSCLTAFKVLTLWAEQARQTITLDNAPASLSTQVIGSAAIPQKLLSFVWDHWDHPIEIVRYQTKAIFEHVVKMHVAVSGQVPSSDEFLKDLTGNLLQVGWHSRGIYGPLSILTSITGAKCLLGWYPSIREQVMEVLRDRITAPHAIDFIDAISKNHKQEILSAGEDMSDWLKTWIMPIINLLRYQGNLEDWVLVEQTLSKLLKCYPESLQFIVENLQNQHDKNVEVLITCLKTARSLGLIKVNDNDSGSPVGETWGEVVPVDWLKKALCHIEEQTRLDALGLLCDSPRTTESISVTDLALLRVFLPLNMNNQSPSFRQQCSTHLKKLLLRMKESLRISAKRLKKTSGDKLNTLRLNSCQEFLQWLSDLLFSSLFPGASFARRTTALHLLKLLSSIFVGDNQAPRREPFVFSDVMTATNVMVLVDCLRDTYDVNKVLAYELLQCCPANTLPFQKPDILQSWLHSIDRLLSSPRAIDSSTASVTLKLLVNKCSLGLYLKPNKQDDLNDGNTLDTDDSLGVESQVYRVLCYLLEMLKSQSAVAEVSLNQAASQAPMHGVLYCLCTMLCHLPLSQFSSDSSWQQLVSSVLDECLHVADLVSPVVTSSSPEGHMVEDDYNDDLDTEGCDTQVFNVSSQILLVCCWRTMKEVALLLGDLVQNAPLRKTITGLLTSQQVRCVGEFFTTLLLTSKHRGAFEIAYNGFVKLCSMLWTCNDDALRLLPQQWLESLISDIANCLPNEVLCGTRRSAGVPFFVQAIVTTEPLASGKSSFKRLTTNLIATASQPIDEEIPKDSTLPQVHARNILRALFRDTRLGEDVSPFVADGLKVAISGFLSDSWAVRNSSTLLFSALMTRIFGVKKSKDEHSKRNCMNGREFFTRFPELHPFLLEQLRQSIEAIEMSSALVLHPSLYPVLVLLSRLYPSTLDGTDSTLNMAAFVPYVIRCGSSSVLKTRAMAARAIVPLVTSETMVTTLQELIQSLPTSLSNVKHNKMHGALLQIHHLVQDHLVQSTPSDHIKGLVTSKVVPMFEPFHWIGTRSNPCEVTRAVFLDIALNLVINPHLEVKDQNVDKVRHTRRVITQIALQDVTTNNGPRPLVSIGQTLTKEACARILLSDSLSSLSSKEHGCSVETTKNPSPMNYCHIVCCLLGSDYYEVRLITLEHLNASLSRCHILSRKPLLSHNTLTKECDHSPGDIDDDGIFSVEDLKQLAAVILEMAIVKEHHLDCLGQVYQVLSLVTNSLSFPQTFSSGETISLVECWQLVLVQACKSSEQRDAIKCALVGFLASMAHGVYQELVCSSDTSTQSTILDCLHVFNSLLKSSSHDDKSFDVRLKTAEVLSNGTLNRFLLDPGKLLGDFPLDLWEIVVNLLHDDDCCVRECAAHIIVAVNPETLQLGSSFSLPPLATTIVLRTVFNHFYPVQPRASLQWMLGWITACSTMQVAVKHSKAGSSDHHSEIDLLFEKNSLNSYKEKLVIAQSVAQCFKALRLPLSKTEPDDVIVKPSDVIDDVIRTALHGLQEVQTENGLDFTNLFMKVYSSILALVATGFLKDAIHGDGSLRTLTLSKLHISSNQEITENVSVCVKELYLKLSTDVRLRDLMEHPLVKTCLQDLCQVYNVTLDVPCL